MARVELLVTVDKLLSDADLASPYLSPVVGASVQVNIRGTGSPATVFAAETGGTTVSNPLVTDANGRINGWVDENSYILGISGAGITSYNQPYEAVRADGISHIAANTVATTHIQASAVNFSKLAADVISNLLPAGLIMAYAGATAPSGWVLCQGQLLDGTQPVNAALWAVVGTTYGGTGQSSFAVPDTRGSALVGVDGGAGRLTANNTRGARSGAEKHTLVTGELAAHTHTQQGAFTTSSGGSHDHAIGSNTTSHIHGGAEGNLVQYNGSSSGADLFVKAWDLAGSMHAFRLGVTAGQSANHVHDSVAGGAHTHSTTISGATTSTGSGTAHNNMPPYLVVNHIIKL